METSEGPIHSIGFPSLLLRMSYLYSSLLTLSDLSCSHPEVDYCF